MSFRYITSYTTWRFLFTVHSIWQLQRKNPLQLCVLTQYDMAHYRMSETDETTEPETSVPVDANDNVVLPYVNTDISPQTYYSVLSAPSDVLCLVWITLWPCFGRHWLQHRDTLLTVVMLRHWPCHSLSLRAPESGKSLTTVSKAPPRFDVADVVCKAHWMVSDFFLIDSLLNFFSTTSYTIRIRVLLFFA